MQILYHKEWKILRASLGLCMPQRIMQNHILFIFIKPIFGTIFKLIENIPKYSIFLMSLIQPPTMLASYRTIVELLEPRS